MNEQARTLVDRLQAKFDAITSTPISATMIQHTVAMTRKAALEASGVSRHLNDETSQRIPLGPYGPQGPSDEKRRRRMYVYSPPLTGHSCREYHTLAIHAGNCIGGWCETYGVAPETVVVSDPASRWLCMLFDLSWATHPEFPARSKKKYLAWGEIFQVAAKQLPSKTAKPDSPVRAGKPPKTAKPDSPIRAGKPLNADDDKRIAELQSVGFHSTLINLALASVYAVDLMKGEMIGGNNPLAVGDANGTNTSTLDADPITIGQAASLVQQTIKTLRNNKPPKTAIINSEKRTHIYSYRKLRPWLLENWPGESHRLPERYEEAQKLLG